MPNVTKIYLSQNPELYSIPDLHPGSQALTLDLNLLPLRCNSDMCWINQHYSLTVQGTCQLLPGLADATLAGVTANILCVGEYSYNRLAFLLEEIIFFQS